MSAAVMMVLQLLELPLCGYGLLSVSNGVYVWFRWLQGKPLVMKMWLPVCAKAREI